MRTSVTLPARVVGVAWKPVKQAPVLRGMSQRQGALHTTQGDFTSDEHNTRSVVSSILAETEFLGPDARPQKPLVDLPGVPHVSDLPADPITRLFFQQKGEYALYQGTYVDPVEKDQDRVQIEKRESIRARDRKLRMLTPLYDFCHRVREASQQKKRFVIVPSNAETKGCAQVMMNHGLVAGFRDFHNDRAFAIELKYFQNESTITYIAPCAFDGKTQFEWSPKMMRRFMNSHGIHNRIVIYICRTADGRVMDHIQAVREHLGGRGLMMIA